MQEALARMKALTGQGLEAKHLHKTVLADIVNQLQAKVNHDAAVAEVSRLFFHAEAAFFADFALETLVAMRRANHLPEAFADEMIALCTSVCSALLQLGGGVNPPLLIKDAVRWQNRTYFNRTLNATSLRTRIDRNATLAENIAESNKLRITGAIYASSLSELEIEKDFINAELRRAITKERKRGVSLASSFALYASKTLTTNELLFVRGLRDLIDFDYQNTEQFWDAVCEFYRTLDASDLNVSKELNSDFADFPRNVHTEENMKAWIVVASKVYREVSVMVYHSCYLSGTGVDLKNIARKMEEEGAGGTSASQTSFRAASSAGKDVLGEAGSQDELVVGGAESGRPTNVSRKSSFSRFTDGVNKRLRFPVLCA